MHLRLFCFLFGLLALGACAALPAARNFTVTLQETQAASGPGDSGVGNLAWEGGELVVPVTAYAMCNSHADMPQVEVIGESVSLTWMWRSDLPSGVAVKSACAHQITFRVKGLTETNDLRVRASAR